MHDSGWSRLGGSVEVTGFVDRRWLRVLIGLFATLLVALTLSGGLSASADSINEDSDWQIKGNVKNEGTPLEGVLISVSGNGFTGEVATDADGKWSVGVPEGGKYTVTLDESTLPKGVIVTDKDGNVIPPTRDVEFGATKTALSNYFLGVGV